METEHERQMREEIEVEEANDRAERFAEKQNIELYEDGGFY